MQCPSNTCKLSRRMINPTGPKSAYYMLVGEASGQHEDRLRKPFVGQSGDELNLYLRRAGIARNNCYVTNLLKCRPPKNRDPLPEEILACGCLLQQEVDEVDPSVIGAIGAFATRWFLGDVDLEMVHGLVFEKDGRLIVPLYHPSYGLHDTSKMAVIAQDFMALKSTDIHYCDTSPVNYCDSNPLDSLIVLEELIAIDTEWAEDRPWCLSYSCELNTSTVVMADDTRTLKAINEHVQNPTTTTILHNALYDLPVLSKMGIYPVNPIDTMIMAYLLQDEPQGLKPLAYRHAHMEMQSYKEVVGVANQDKAIRYLIEVMGREWPKPDTVFTWVKGEPHVKQPQNISKKVYGILRDVKKGADPWKRWNDIDVDGGRGMVEEVLGTLEYADLSEIPREDAIYYAARDADATFRIYPSLLRRIQEWKLEEVLKRDMGTIPMLLDMMSNGMKIDKEHFGMLSVLYGKRIVEIGMEIDKIAGRHVNPNSVGPSGQLPALLFDQLRIQTHKKSTDQKVLEVIKDAHPVVPLVIDFRKYTKLKTTYVDKLPGMADEASRVHTSFSITRTVTGRLASRKPNLMNQPVSSEEGLRIREGFVAEDGYSIVSIDFSQIEMRMAAHESEDTVMMRLFRDGKDLHAETAARIFGISIDAVDEKLHRYPSKRIGFGIIYGITPEGLFRELRANGINHISVEDCKRLIVEWFRMYQGVRDWMDRVRAHARMYEYVRDMFGRIRLVPEVKSALSYIREAGLRQAINAPEQMGAQGVIKEAMVQLVHIYREFGEDVRPLIQVHDDLTWEIRDSVLDVAIPVIQSVMNGCVKLKVPVLTDVKVGRNWRDLEKWKLN